MFRLLFRPGIAGGDVGWKDANPNVLLMACFHLLTNHLTHSICRPLWWAAGVIGAAGLLFVIRTLWTWATGG